MEHETLAVKNKAADPSGFSNYLLKFRDFGKKTKQVNTEVKLEPSKLVRVPTFINEFWTSKQRKGHSLHEISYRACFKAEVPEFFINKLSKPGEIVYDPFLGRGTTALQASLSGRVAFGNDVNPLSKMLVEPRLSPPSFEEISSRLSALRFHNPKSYPKDLEVFFHPTTLNAICCLREYFLEIGEEKLDGADNWIRMVAISRLTGHSRGFFSVYSLPPNQAVSLQSQRKINKKRKQQPEERDIKKLILKKTRSLLRDPIPSHSIELREKNKILIGDSRQTRIIPDNSVTLVVTSPPFLDVVDYALDNWMRLWFVDLDPLSLAISKVRTIPEWKLVMLGVFLELRRILRKGGHIAFEVGEIRGGKVRLEESVVECGIQAGLFPELILINSQNFTKTANIWGISNSTKGTNTNRVVLFQKV